jgi:putative cell wall-binding protein
MRGNLPHTREVMQSLPPARVGAAEPAQPSPASRTLGRPMRRHVVVLACVLAALAVAACGRADRSKTSTNAGDSPGLGVKGSQPEAAHDLGFPAFATKNTTRIGGADSIANAAGVARAVFPATTPENRPAAVALIDARDWRAGIAGSVLASTPVRAAVLLSNGPELPDATRDALAALQPRGAKDAGGAQVIRVGDVARPAGMRTTDIAGRDAFALARALDAFQTAARGKTSDRVLVVSADDPAFAMPAAAWAAKAGDPVLFVHRDSVPQETKAALLAHDQPRIYILGPPAAVSGSVASALKKLGTVKRLGADNPIDSAIAFARYTDPTFGWGVVDPGHGLVFASAKRPLDAAAGSMLSTSGTYGPLLLVPDATTMPPALQGYLLDIQPGYEKDPVRGVYNHGWIMGDETAISADVQARIDTLLEIQPVNKQEP